MANYQLVPAEVPEYAIATDLARTMNADALAGISTGFPASIRIKSSKFRLVDGNGEETILKSGDLADGEYLPIIVLAAKPGLNKVYYAQAYDPNQTEALQPDCFSNDGERPDPSVAKPMHSICATCPKNAFGSGVNAAGQPTKGKACSDNKILAVLYKGEVYQFKIPPASLKNWGVFVKRLSARGIPVGHVVAYVGFDENADYSVLVFRVGDFVPEAKIPKLMDFVDSPEVHDIIAPTLGAPAAAKQEPKEEPAIEPVAKNSGSAAADALGGDDEEEVEEKPKPKAVKPAPKKAEKEEEEVVSDDEISKLLDL